MQQEKTTASSGGPSSEAIAFSAASRAPASRLSSSLHMTWTTDCSETPVVRTRPPSGVVRWI